MATVVLVHGAWCGGWYNKRVARLLRQQGHEVHMPTLTGLGERSHLMNSAIDLGTHIADVMGVIRWEELHDIVLCGHSYGGMVISGVAEQAEDKIRALVFLDAFVPQNGQSLLDLLQPEQAQQMRADARLNGEGYALAPIPAAAFNTNGADIAWVDAMCGKQPIGTFEQKIALTGARERVPRRVFVFASDWGPSPFQQFYERLQHNPAWQVRTITCGHAMQLDRPQETAEMIAAAAERI